MSPLGLCFPLPAFLGHLTGARSLLLFSSLMLVITSSQQSDRPLGTFLGRTLAGKGTLGITAAGCGDSPVQMTEPIGMTVSPDGQLYVLDRTCQRVIRYPTVPAVGSEGIGEVVLEALVGGFPNNLRQPQGLGYDASTGDLLIADTNNHRILRWKPGGFSGAPEVVGAVLSHKNGALWEPNGVFVRDGIMYTVELQNHRVQMFDLASCCGDPFQAVGETIRGCPALITMTPPLYCSSGSDLDHLQGPLHVFVASNSDIYVTDTLNHRIIQFNLNVTDSTSGNVTSSAIQIVAGTSGIPGCRPEQLRLPHATAVDPDGYLYVVDTGNHRIQKFAPQKGERVAITVAGECCCPRVGVDGVPVGGFSTFQLNEPRAVTFDPLTGALLVLDSGNLRVIAFGENTTEVPVTLGGSCAYGVECVVQLTGQIRAQGGQLLIARREFEVPRDINGTLVEENATGPCGSFHCSMPTWAGVSYPVAAEGSYLDTFSFGVPRGPIDNSSTGIGGEYVLCWGRSPATPCMVGECGGHDNCSDSNTTSWLCAGAQPFGITRRVWLNIDGDTVASLTESGQVFPDSPDKEEPLQIEMSTPMNYADQYGQQLKGLFTAPQTGTYTFHITSNHNSELWISDTWNETGRLVAYISESSVIVVNLFPRVGYASGPADWDSFSSQSGTFEMEAGQIYMVEVLHKEGTGSDHLRVGVTLPAGEVLKPIPVSLFEAKVCDAGLPAGLGVIHDCFQITTGQSCTAKCEGGFVGAEETFRCDGVGTLLGVVPACISVTCREYDVEVGRFFMHGVLGKPPDPVVCLDCKYINAGTMPYGMTTDTRGYLITADTQHHVVVRWWGDRSEVLAGGHGAGNALNQLYWPNGVFFVTGEGAAPHVLYIADMYNHRIMRYFEGDISGEIVFGTGIPGDNITELRYPVSVYVHYNGTMYIQDYGNARVMRVNVVGDLKGEVVEDEDAAGLGVLPGAAADSFFDGSGNYFAADYGADSLMACLRKHACGFTQCQDSSSGAEYGPNCGCRTTVQCSPGFGALPGGRQPPTAVMSL